MTASGEQPAARLARKGAAAGLVTAAAALGVGQLAAGLIDPQASPVVAVGEAAIGLAPPPVKNLFIAVFGSHDKTALVTSILLVLAAFAAVIGAAAVRRLAYGLAGLAVFTGIGVAAAVARPGSGVDRVLPTLIGAAAAALVLVLLVRTVTGQEKHPGGTPHAPGEPAAGSPAGAATGPGGAWVPAGLDPPAARSPDPGTAPAAQPFAVPAAPARRQFLVYSTAAVAVAGASALGGRVLAERTSVAQARSALRLPAARRPGPALPAGADLRVPGLEPFVTPNGSFYRVDTALVVPEVVPGSWQLRIHGMVARDLTLSLRDLLKMPLAEEYITLTCVSDPVGGPYIGNARWLGPSLARVLRAAGIRRGADQLLCTSVDGFTSGTPVQTVMDGRHALLAVAMNGAPLPVAHGFPVRMVVPGLYGYVSATKWVTDIKVTTFAAESAYWVQRGWSQQAPIKTESRIDVPNGRTTLRRGRVAVAGVAWAQHKGIDAVEVRVDRGPWQRATLGAVPGPDTWRQWVWYWDAAPGRHTIEARATDATGYTQTRLPVPPEPNGATGYPSVRVSVS